MRVLWLCNIMLPAIAKHLGKEENHKEGWLSGTYNRLKQADFSLPSGEKIELGVCFPVSSAEDEFSIKLPDVQAFGFYENTNHPENYDASLEVRLKKIVKKFNPDLVHCFGTEYPHTLAMTRVFPYPDKILIGIQGLCHKCAEDYMALLPRKVQKSRTFRDIIKKDTLMRQQEKFTQRGINEIEAIKNVNHITGRTRWDNDCVADVKKLNYHFMNETLRKEFYDGQWEMEKCIPHSIFLSQGDYPLKGLHFVLEALPKVLEEFPDTKLFVAGNNLTATKTLKDKIKISAYGKYLRRLMKKNHLEDKVLFLGRLSAGEMKDRYLKSHLYICPSSVENSPNSLGEAMLLGVPAIASYAGGIPTIMTDREDGILFEMGNADKLAEAVLYVFKNPKEAEKYRQNARKHAKDTHNPDKNYLRLLEIYQEIV